AAPPEASARLLLGDASAAGNSIDGAIVVVGDQHRAVLHRQHVHGPTDVVVVLDEAGDERLHRPEGAVAVQLDADHVAADLYASVPGAVAGKEDGVTVFAAEPVNRVELQTERGTVGPEQRDRLGELAALASPAEFRIGEVALVAVGIAEVVLAGLGDTIEL